jgi:hypothetical protein
MSLDHRVTLRGMAFLSLMGLHPVGLQQDPGVRAAGG